MSKARLLIALAICFLPTLALADSTDPQMDPNDCTGSFSLAPINALNPSVFSLFTDNTNTTIVQSFTALDPTILGQRQPSSCVANNTGGTITSLMVSTPEVNADSNILDYTCPNTGGCTVSISDGIVTYDFTKIFDPTTNTIVPIDIANGAEFGFTTLGFDANSVYSLTNVDPTNEKVLFKFQVPEPGTLTLLASGAFPLWAALRRRKK